MTEDSESKLPIILPVMSVVMIGFYWFSMGGGFESIFYGKPYEPTGAYRSFSDSNHIVISTVK